MWASQNGHSKIVELRHEYGAQVDLQSISGVTALMVASEKGHSKIAFNNYTRMVPK